MGSGCGKGPPTELRLIASQENGHEKIHIAAPPQALKINEWIDSCGANVAVIYQSPRILSIACRDNVQVYASFRLDTGNHLSLRDVIHQDRFDQLLEAITREQGKKGKKGFTPTNNFAMAAQGLLFPTPEGEVIVSSIDLRPLLKPDVALLVGR